MKVVVTPRQGAGPKPRLADCIRLFVALGICLAGTRVQAFSITDVTFQVPPDAPQFAAAAELLPGNDNVAAVNSLGGAYAGDAWTLMDKTDDPSTEFMGVTFVLDADEDASSGNWSLSWSETGSPGLPLIMDFVFVTKAANDWGAYLFESITFTTDPMTGNGTFAITWTNNGGQIPGLSHASIYGRGAEAVIEVPVPSSLLLLGMGIYALRRSMRKRPAPQPGRLSH